MQILAHRGFWLQKQEQNTEVAFVRALDAGYGIETDLRDLCGQVVLSHDVAKRGAMPLRRFLELYVRYPRQPLLALNVKADGLQQLIRHELASMNVTNYFLFDMSVPDMLEYMRLHLPVYARRSEFEPATPLTDKVCGSWLDYFGDGYVPVDWIAETIANRKLAAIVSPELHHREHMGAWRAWRKFMVDNQFLSRDDLSLCTDWPREAEAFFAWL